ncbi:hypothetical protein LEP1GSC050_0192 [Leptospira broomii serovar Hurstbridge str. 5399]|uniref:Uncharacterized protein n=1 Tax=Leptospira broomii serovar Hurstbridge str. 5399 TaxID=1049789 RepID=T0F636_9LEPT|nr:hypothetical protein LEP1GSC050_0192 [Leptospira broomii serovar Hurstbridge str. 5399]
MIQNLSNLRVVKHNVRLPKWSLDFRPEKGPLSKDFHNIGTLRVYD